MNSSEHSSQQEFPTKKGTESVLTGISSPPIPHLVRIPGSSDNGPDRAKHINGKSYSVLRLIEGLHAPQIETRTSAVAHLTSIDDINNNDFHRIADSLFSTGHLDDPSGAAARDGLEKLILQRISSPDALHLCFQIMKIAIANPLYCECIARLTHAIEHCWNPNFEEAIQDRKKFLELRSLSLRAIETDKFLSRGCKGLHQLLTSSVSELKADRRDLAGSLLSTIRRLENIPSPLIELKKLASFVFTVGTVPSSNTTPFNTVLVEKERLCTSFMAEQRRMFGLASVIELSKARSLIGRRLRSDEYKALLRFGPSAILREPSNCNWPTSTEFRTMLKILSHGIFEIEHGKEEIAALLKILGNRIRITDPLNPAIPISVAEDVELRKEALSLLSKFIGDKKLSEQEVTTLASSIAADLLTGDFSSFIANPIPGISEGSQFSPFKHVTLDVEQFIESLSSPDAHHNTLRLSPEQLHVLRQTQGLSLEQFKSLTSSLRARAISCEWARGALLELVKSPHAPDVTAEIRTNTLGNFISDARKSGKLTQGIEKQVFSISAEIPRLGFLRNN
jgi:hypothetical protein